MESVVTRARMFKHKPDGDVTFMKLRDRNGVPVPVFQDPMHYPHGTKFLAPGICSPFIGRREDSVRCQMILVSDENMSTEA